MTRGRRADPPGVKAAKGNTRRQAVVKPGAASAASASPSAMPAFLKTGKKDMEKLTEGVWAFLQLELSKINFLRATDKHALARFCRYMAEWINCTRVMDKEGAWYETSSPHVEKMMRPHPAARHRKEAEQALRMLEGELGLTPASRQRLQMQMLASPNLGLGMGGEQGHGQPAGGELFPAAQAGPVGFLAGRVAPQRVN